MLQAWIAERDRTIEQLQARVAELEQENKVESSTTLHPRTLHGGEVGLVGNHVHLYCLEILMQIGLPSWLEDVEHYLDIKRGLRGILVAALTSSSTGRRTNV